MKTKRFMNRIGAFALAFIMGLTSLTLDGLMVHAAGILVEINANEETGRSLGSKIFDSYPPFGYHVYQGDILKKKVSLISELDEIKLADGEYTAYKRTYKGTPEETTAVNFTVRNYYMVNFSVTEDAPTDAAVTLDGNAVTGAQKCYADTEYTVAVKDLEGYGESLIVDDIVQETMSYTGKITKSVVGSYAADKYATVNVDTYEGGTVKVNDKTESLVTIPEGNGFTVTATPNKGYVLKSLEVKKGDAAVGTTVESVAADEVYTVAAVFEKIELRLKDGQTLKYYDGMDKTNITNTILALVYDGENSKNVDINVSAPSDNVEVKYLAASIIGQEIWATPGDTVDKILDGLGALAGALNVHAFGLESENIKVTYKAASGDIEATTVITLADIREEEALTVTTPITVEYSETDGKMYEQMIEKTGAALGTLSSNQFSYTIDGNAVTNSMLKSLAEENPAGSVTVTVSFNGNDTYKPAEAKTVTVSFSGVYYYVLVTVSGWENGGVKVGETEYKNGDAIKAFYNEPLSVEVITSDDWRAFVGTTEYPDSANGTIYTIDAVDKTSKIEVSYSDGSVVITTQPENGELKVNDSTDTVLNVEKNTVVTVVVKATGEYFVEDVVIKENGVRIAPASKTWSGDVLTATFTTASTSKNYEVSAVVKQAALVPRAERILTWYEGVSYADLKKEVFEAVVDTANSVPDTITYDQIDRVEYLAGTDLMGNEVWKSVDASLSVTEKILYHEFGKETEQVRITWNGEESPAYPALVLKTDIALQDNRIATVIRLKENISFTYGETIDPLSLIVKEVTTEAGEAISWSASDISFDKDVAALNAGEHTVLVTYGGNKTYKGVSAEAKVTVAKAPSSVQVASQVVDYTGISIENLITTTPGGVSHISFLVGLDAEGSGYVQVNLPELIDLEAIENPTLKGLAEALLETVYGMLENEISVADLATTLESALEILSRLEDYDIPINLDTKVISVLISALEAVENLDGISELKVKFTVGKDITPTNAGVYLVGAVTADANYETSVNAGYLVIKPQATKVTLDFNIKDENGFITRGSILSGEYDLGSHVVNDGTLSAQNYEIANSKVTNVYIGYDINGDFVITNTPSAEVGAYTQIAYIRDLGNEMYWAVPIIRVYAVVADLVDVKFIDENGAENPDRAFTFDNTPKAMTAYAFDRNGSPLDSKDISYTYFGTESDGEVYYSETAPSQAGVYTVVATYKNEDHSLVGVAVGAMVITPAKATVVADNKIHTYDGSAAYVMEMITKTPEDARIAVLMAGLEVSGDFSENGINAIKGVVNIDFPERADEVLREMVPDAYADGITLTSFISKIEDIKAGMEEAGINTAFVTELLAVLKQMPDTTTLTFKEQADVNPSDIGAYLVGAVAFDPNYVSEPDFGILIIAPEIIEANLEWNYKDANGIITYPILHSVDLGASAFTDGVKDSELTAKVSYIFLGVDGNGKVVITDDASELGNGIYTQIAYIYDEISASMVIAKPILREFVIVPQTVTVDFVDLNANDMRLFTYDGTPKTMDVIVTDMAGNEISDELLEQWLTVAYIGIDTENGTYYSTTAPTQIGAYSVIASYVEYDAKGELVRAGMDMGVMVIEPKNGRFTIEDTELLYDGNEKMPKILKDDNLSYIAIIVDKDNNINIVFPDSWGIASASYDITDNISEVVTALEQAAGSVHNEELKTLITELKKVLEEIEGSVGILSLNGKKPVEEGEYNVIGIAYGNKYKIAVDSGKLTIIKENQDGLETPSPEPSEEPSATPSPEPSEEPSVTPTPAPDGESAPTSTPKPVKDEDEEEEDDKETSAPVPTQTPADTSVKSPHTGESIPVVGCGILLFFFAMCIVLLEKKRIK